MSAWTGRDTGVLLAAGEAGEAGVPENDLRLDQPNPRLAGLRLAAGGVASCAATCEGVAEAEGAGRPWITPTLGPESKRRPVGAVAGPGGCTEPAGATATVDAAAAALVAPAVTAGSAGGCRPGSCGGLASD